MSTGATPNTRSDREVQAAAADLFNGLLDLIESGEIEATSAHAKRMARRIEGAVTALSAASGTQTVILTPDGRDG